jgi:hypothetical protein
VEAIRDSVNEKEENNRDVRDNIREIKKLLKQGQYSSDIILNRVSDIMDAANFEKNSYHLNCSYFNLPSLLKATLNSVKFMLSNKRMKSSLRINQNLLKLFS